MTSSAAQRIAAFVVAFDPESVTEALLESVARSLFDTHAVAIGGFGEPAAVRARAYVEALGWPTGGATVWGLGERTVPETAALLNGITAHVLDYDDVNSPMRGHPSVVLWPALVALGEHRDLAGSRLASAYVVGFEVLVKLSRAMAEHHYALGWHSTPGLGTLAATAACAHLLELDEEATAHALGLAVAQTAGTRQNFGSDAKSFQAGQACAAAIRATSLAEQGFTAGSEAIDGAGGFLSLYGGKNEAFARQLNDLGQCPLELLASGIEVKKYPMCYAAHRALDGILDLHAMHGLTLNSVVRVDVRSSRDGLIPLIYHRPQDGLQAKFSIEYAVAAALSDGALRLSSFRDEQVQRPEIQAFFERVDAHEVSESLFPRFVELIVTLDNGNQLRRRIDALRGSAELPLRDDDLIAKAQDCYGSLSIDGGAILGILRQMKIHSIRSIVRGQPFHFEMAAGA